MSVVIVFRSLTHAQRGARLIAGAGIPGKIIKAPPQIIDRGCAYGVLITERRSEQAIRALRDAGAIWSGVFIRDASGQYREAEI